MRQDVPNDGPQADLAQREVGRGLNKAHREPAPKFPPAPFSHSPKDLDPRCHLRESELAQRWRITLRTLRRWRRQGRAPAHLRLGQTVLYRTCDIEAFEADSLIGGS